MTAFVPSKDESEQCDVKRGTVSCLISIRFFDNMNTCYREILYLENKMNIHSIISADSDPTVLDDIPDPDAVIYRNKS